MPNSEAFHSDRAPAAVGPYSQAIAPTVPGRPIYLSGQIGLNPEIPPPRAGSRQRAGKNKAILVPGDIEAETRQVFTNIKAVLEATGLKLSDILSMDVLLADIKDYAAVNKIYAEEFGEHKPARAAFQAAQLPLGAKVEMKAIAWQPKKN